MNRKNPVKNSPILEVNYLEFCQYSEKKTCFIIETTKGII